MADPAAEAVERSARRGGSRRAFGLTGVALVVSGLLVNAYLALVARSMTAQEYVAFSAFWSISLLVGFGVFLPVEQLLAKSLPGSTDRRQLVARAARVAATLAAAEALIVLAGSWLIVRSLGDSWGVLVAVLAMCLVSAGQFVVRGLLIGLGRIDLYGAVLVLDAGLRVGLAAVLAAAGARTSSIFAWTLVVAIVVAHAPVALRVVRLPEGDGAAPATGELVRPVLLLLIGSLGAQVLLNGPPIALAAVVGAADAERGGSFQAAFQLVRIPLFLAVPLQATIVPVMQRLLARTTVARQVTLLARFVAGTLALAVVAVALGWTIGPTLLEVLFGRQYRVPGDEIAVMAGGVAVYLGLLVVTQVLVAGDRHLLVAASWGAGAAVFLAVFVVVPHPVTAAGVAFTSGCVAGLLVGLVGTVVGAGSTTAGVPPVPGRGSPTP